MRFALILAGFVLTQGSQAICPFAKRALEDPEFFKQHLAKHEAAHEKKEKRQTGPGGLPFTTFSEDQLVDVTGQYAWQAPGPNDLRGPCPGLNALANHGYFPHVSISGSEDCESAVRYYSQFPAEWCGAACPGCNWY